MCGICGFAGVYQNNDMILNDMLARIRHRGPDEYNTHVNDHVALGFCRLSFIDVECGRQPLYNEDGTLVLIFNGEIYNYKSLQRELIAKGHIFSTASDSEVILHGYEEYGLNILSMLRGMFAFCIYNTVNETLFFARDPFGIKPFYYYSDNKAFMFSSEIKSFLAHPEFTKELNTDCLSYYLSFGFTPLNKTLFKNVFKLDPGSYLEYNAKNSELKTAKYFQFSFNNENKVPFDECVEDVGAVITDSVKAHSMRDTKINMGSFLSSGVDSNYIMREAAKDPNFKVFSIGYDSEKYSELPYARNNSRDANVSFHPCVIDSEEYLANTYNVAFHLDEPVADPSVPAIYSLTKEARKHVKFVLSGEGADELFAGYNSYKRVYYTEKYRKIPKFIRYSCAAIAKKIPSLKGRNFIIDGNKPLEERYIGCGSILLNKKEQQLLLKNKELYRDPSSIVKEILANTSIKDDVSRAQYVDISLWLPNDILLKADKMSMAHSLEVRTPFLDKEVYEVGRNIFGGYKVNRKNTKLVLRQAAANKMPANISNKKKLGFPVPLREWLQDDKFFAEIKRMFTGEITEEFFNLDYLQKILREEKLGTGDHRRKIWLIYSFLVWYTVFFVTETYDDKKKVEGKAVMM